MFADRDLVTVKAGDRSGSELFQRISSDDADLQMPPPDSGKTLSKDQVLSLLHISEPTRPRLRSYAVFWLKK